MRQFVPVLIIIAGCAGVPVDHVVEGGDGPATAPGDGLEAGPGDGSAGAHVTHPAPATTPDWGLMEVAGEMAANATVLILQRVQSDMQTTDRFASQLTAKTLGPGALVAYGPFMVRMDDQNRTYVNWNEHQTVVRNAQESTTFEADAEMYWISGARNVAVGFLAGATAAWTFEWTIDNPGNGSTRAVGPESVLVGQGVVYEDLPAMTFAGVQETQGSMQWERRVGVGASFVGIQPCAGLDCFAEVNVHESWTYAFPSWECEEGTPEGRIYGTLTHGVGSVAVHGEYLGRQWEPRTHRFGHVALPPWPLALDHPEVMRGVIDGDCEPEQP